MGDAADDGVEDDPADPADAEVAEESPVGSVSASAESPEAGSRPGAPASRLRFGGSGGGIGINGRVSSGASKTRVRSSPSRFGV
ncbi:hypothetical protein Caci_8088 [Catenulispora acidiphila DSM 44928]|uniref:Uncharacterized protein n=1 Tax=Catenulispora acidiphila (strain DSM 44928 / JCM 14897 / NBRC 102108 / NRRL B-24433 / ID139908) TaxID=479433 RepID=C7QH61_CATAD|nr:hypothetical protein Caci_8088 [Catenulispora acidiphila DSM 44928]